MGMEVTDSVPEASDSGVAGEGGNIGAVCYPSHVVKFLFSNFRN